jgi:hypothetical protein
MGFFGIVRSNVGDDFEVVECHINLWALAGLFRRRCFYLDVGLRLRARQQGIMTFDVLLPVGVYNKDAQGIRDLYHALFDANVCQLIFGRRVEISNDSATLTYEGSDGEQALRLTQLDVPACTRVEEYSGKTFSYWRLRLNSAIRSEPDTYLRIRFVVQNCGRVWIWKRSGFARNGALVDMRITDLRESNVATEWAPDPDRLVPIQRLNLFTIAPSWLQLRAVSPHYHYMRLFEGRVWERYLKRAFDPRRKEKLIIYQWRNPDGPVGPANPFHAFIDFSREFGLLRLANHFRTAVVVVLVGALAVEALRFYKGYQIRITNHLEAIFSTRVITVSGVITLAVAIFWLLFRYVEKFQKLFKAVRNKFLLFEESYFRKKARE